MSPAGYFKDSWRRPNSRVEEVGGLELVSDIAQAAEAAKIHACFFADVVSAASLMDGDMKITGIYEPMTTLAALAARTKHIGLIGSASTSFYDPYNLARLLSGLDNLSGGRAGWNIVTSWMGNANYGLDEMPSADERYRRATEFVDVVLKLWSSWTPDAVISDRESGNWIDTSKVTPINHRGEHFSVSGALNLRPSPQLRPLLVQAGQSAAGLDLGSSVADFIYTLQPDLAKAQEFYAHCKSLAAGKGRDPEKTYVMPGIIPIVGDTAKEAAEISHELGTYINMDHGRSWMTNQHAIDLTDIDLDECIPEERFNVNDSRFTSRGRHIMFLAIEKGLTLREVIIEDARGGGHQWIEGTPQSIADHMVEWFDSRACDGFNLNPPYLPEGLDKILKGLVPELQERGYFQDEYRGTTLRENLGIDLHEQVPSVVA